MRHVSDIALGQRSPAEISARTCRVRGNAFEAGLALGHALGSRLSDNIARYIETGPARQRSIDRQRLSAGALRWLRRLPERYQAEMQGIAEGAGVPLQLLAEWCYIETDESGGCSACLVRDQDHVWIARNNDLWAPDMWGYVTIHEITGRIPRMDFGLQGEIFTSSGVNAEHLWLHYNWLPAPDRASSRLSSLPCFVWLSEALESCRSLDEVEAVLRNLPRDGAMMLFAVDGKTESGAVYECTCTDYRKLPLTGRWRAGTNHYQTDLGGSDGEGASSSYVRLRRMEALLHERDTWGEEAGPPRGLVRILADPEIEQRGPDAGTVYAAVACPSVGRIWYTYGGYPAASRGAWASVPWPW